MLTDQAYETWSAQAGSIARIAASLGDDPLALHLGKWPGILARMLLTYHAIESAARRKHPTEWKVSLATANQVTQLSRQFLLQHAQAFYGNALQQQTHHKAAAKVADIILVRDWHSFTMRDIAAQWRAWRSMDERYQASVLSHLDLMGWITEVEPATKPGRRPDSLYDVNPLVHSKFAHHREHEKQRREQLTSDWRAATKGANHENA